MEGLLTQLGPFRLFKMLKVLLQETIITYNSLIQFFDLKNVFCWRPEATTSNIFPNNFY